MEILNVLVGITAIFWIATGIKTHSDWIQSIFINESKKIRQQTKIISEFGYGALNTRNTLEAKKGLVFAYWDKPLGKQKNKGTPEQMHDSLSILAALPKHTKVFCTHEYTQSNLKFAIEVEPDNIALKKKIESVNLLRKKDIKTLPSTIELELQINPFLRCSQPEVIKSAEKYSGSQLSSPSEVLGSIRDWKDNF